MKKTKILVTGGGTGGHMYPIISVVAELQTEALNSNRKLRIRYVGSTNKRYRKILKDNGVEVRRILGSKLRRYFSLANFIDVPKFLISLLQAFWSVFLFKPTVVFSKGGPGSVPVVLAANLFKIPIVIHESDSIPSLTGNITARFAKVIAISFKSAEKHFEKFPGRIILTGNPIRTSLLKEKTEQKKAKAFVEFDKDEPLILVLGGSQGAAFINNLVLDNLDKMLEITQVFHQTGRDNYEKIAAEFAVLARQLPENLANRYKAVDYFDDDISLAYSAADIVISRPGAGGIFEIAAFEKPSILIPITESANNHQKFNAVEYSETGAAVVFEEKNLLPQVFLRKIKELISDEEKLAQMSAATSEFYKPDAAKKLADILLNIKGEV